MPIGSGIAGQIGFGVESIYGTRVAPTRFLEFNNESLEADVGHVDSTGIGTGRFLRHNRTRPFIRGAAGSIELDVMTRGFGLIFQHMLGQNTVAQVGGTAEFTHTCIPDSLALQGKFMTVQVGRPDSGGTVRAFDYLGGKIMSWELQCEIDAILKLMLEMDFKTVVNDQSLASASYPSGIPFVFTEGALTIGGSAKHVRSASVRQENALDTDRRFLGNLKKEPLANAISEISGELDAEFEDLGDYDDFVSGAQAELVLTFTSTTLIPTTANPFKLIATLPAIEYSGSTPQIGGPEVLRQSLPFRALKNASDPVVELVLHTDDVAA